MEAEGNQSTRAYVWPPHLSSSTIKSASPQTSLMRLSWMGQVVGFSLEPTIGLPVNKPWPVLDSPPHTAKSREHRFNEMVAAAAFQLGAPRCSSLRCWLCKLVPLWVLVIVLWTQEDHIWFCLETLSSRKDRWGRDVGAGGNWGS